MNIEQFIQEQLNKPLEQVSREDLMKLIQQLNEEKKELKKQKRYGLVWENQVEEVEEFLKKNYPLLTEVKEREIVTDTNKPINLLIEGDNLHALNTLLFTHREKVDVIYIDPPYNTGNKDFRYNDRYIDSEDGWRHSKWLSFMYKRLMLARELLTNTGSIFISIDDNEFSQLKMICDSVFGEVNFVANFIRKTATGPKTAKPNVDKHHEYLLCYAKNKNDVKIKGDLKDFKGYSNPDNDPNGEWTKDSILIKIDNGRTAVNAKYPIHNEYLNITHYPPIEQRKQWHYTKNKFDELVKNGQVVFYKDKSEFKGEYSFYIKKYKKDLKSDTNNVSTLFAVIDNHTNAIGTNELKEIMGEKVFDGPKPRGLIKKILEYTTDKSSVILDFFGGSGTSGHAVVELNAEDDGNRQFILVTNNENNICEEVTYERLKRVMTGYTTPKDKKVEGLGGNLKYYRTDFVSKETYSEELKLQLAEKSHELLSIKENCFFPHKETNRYKIITNHQKAMAIYTDSFRLSTFHELQEELLSLPQPQKLLYILSMDEGEELSYELQQLVELGIEVKPIPRKIKELFDQALR